MESNVFITELVGFLPMFHSVSKEPDDILEQYLLVEQTEDRVRIIGSTRAMMVMYQRESAGIAGIGLLPIPNIKDLKRRASKYDPNVTLRWEEENRIDILSAGETISEHLEHIPSTYPQYRRVIPKSVSGYKAQYNPDLLKILKNVFTQLTGKEYMRVHYNGNNAAVIVSPHNVNILGLLMPWRVSEQEPEPILEKFRQ